MDDVAKVVEYLKNMFPGLDPLTVTKVQALENQTLSAWMEKHCRTRQYVFQVMYY